MQLLSQVMVRLALVLILGISTMSCSVHPPRVEYGYSKVLEGGSGGVTLKIPFDCSICQMIYRINPR